MSATIVSFTASFFLLAAPDNPIVHIVGYRTLPLCRVDAARIAKDIRLPGGIKIGVGFKCASARKSVTGG